jgi:hypothetical protein
MAAGNSPFWSTPTVAELDPWAPRLPPPACWRTRSWGRSTGAAGRRDGEEASAPPWAATALGAPSEAPFLESSRCPCPFTGSWFPEPDFIAAAETCADSRKGFCGNSANVRA